MAISLNMVNIWLLNKQQGILQNHVWISALSRMCISRLRSIINVLVLEKISFNIFLQNFDMARYTFSRAIKDFTAWNSMNDNTAINISITAFLFPYSGWEVRFEQWHLVFLIYASNY